MTKRVEVWLNETSEPIVHEAINTYTKGLLYCVYCEDERVFKYGRFYGKYFDYSGTSILLD